MRDDDSGEVTTQTVLMVPVVILILMISIQAALWFHTANVAQATAGEGAAAVSSAGIDAVEAADRGTIAATGFSSDAGVVLAAPPVVAVDGSWVGVTVEVVVPRIVPFFPSIVSRTVIEPREVIVLEVDR